MLKLLNLDTVVFRQCQQNYWIIHIPFISSLPCSNKCSEFNLISLFIFLSKHKTFYEQNFLIYTFSNKDLITLHRELNWNVCIVLHKKLHKMKSLLNFMVIMKYQTTMFNNSLFISLSQFVAIPWNVFQVSFY